MIENFYFWISTMFGLLSLYYISRVIVDRFYNSTSLSELEASQLGSFEKGWTNRMKKEMEN